jgi:hypothetical protein
VPDNVLEFVLQEPEEDSDGMVETIVSPYTESLLGGKGAFVGAMPADVVEKMCKRCGF